jgi:hypothetical protein
VRYAFFSYDDVYMPYFGGSGNRLEKALSLCSKVLWDKANIIRKIVRSFLRLPVSWMP